LVTFTYWSFSEKKNKYGLVVSIYERELRVNNETEDNKNYVSMILLLQNGEIKEYYAFSDDMIVIHTR
jgi:hypothetical protein